MAIKQTDLKESNDFLNTLLDNITSAIFIVDDELRVQNFNDSFKSIFLNESAQLEPGLCGNVLGCIYAVEEKLDCGQTTNCDKCNLRNALLRSLMERIPTIKEKIVRPFYIGGVKKLKHLQYSTKYIQYSLFVKMNMWHVVCGVATNMWHVVCGMWQQKPRVEGYMCSCKYTCI